MDFRTRLRPVNSDILDKANVPDWDAKNWSGSIFAGRRLGLAGVKRRFADTRLVPGGAMSSHEEKLHIQ
jgi:hypothetical protein